MTPGALPTVLVVDDDPEVADAHAAQLDEAYRVVTAYSGEEALEKLDANTDVALLDRRMPGLSGDDVLDRIREAEIDCRVAMVTAVDPDFDIIEMPFDDYVTKPVSNENLVDTIERLLTCTEYENRLQEYYRLSSKYAALRSNKDDAELESSERFHTLERSRREVRRELETTVDRFEDRHFTAVFREFRDGEPARRSADE